MKISKLLLAAAILLVTSLACAQETTIKDEGDEEKGTKMKINEKFDEVRKGVKMILTYDKTSSSFVGTVENVTEKTIKKVRIEVHLSNGLELGPTTPINLAAGIKSDVKLSAEGQSFKWWKAHAESGEGEEHEGENGEHEGEKSEHGRERGEHGEKRGEHSSEREEH